MTRDELLFKLRCCKAIEVQDGDSEAAHSIADEALLEYINDSAVTEYFRDLTRWFA